MWTTRHPLKTRDTALAGRIAPWLADARIGPNHISLAGIAAAGIAPGARLAESFSCLVHDAMRFQSRILRCSQHSVGAVIATALVHGVRRPSHSRFRRCGCGEVPEEAVPEQLRQARPCRRPSRGG